MEMLSGIGHMLSKQLDIDEQNGLFPSEDFHGFAVNATCKLERADGTTDGPSAAKYARRIGLVWDGYCWRILLKAPREAQKKSVWGPVGCPGASYVSSIGFCTFKDSKGETVCGIHGDGIENPSIKAFMKRELKQKGGPCDRYHGHGACPRGLFARAPPEGPVGGSDGKGKEGGRARKKKEAKANAMAEELIAEEEAEKAAAAKAARPRGKKA